LVVKADLETRFNRLADALFAALSANESLALSLSGEASQFIRINGACVRQTGLVDDLRLSLNLITGERQCSGSITLVGDEAGDRDRALLELQRLREEAAQLPADPYIVAPVGGRQSHGVRHGRLLDNARAAGQLVAPMQGADLTGIYAAGRIYRAHANSAGSRHWFETDSYTMDYSLLNPQERMVKSTLAGVDWSDADWAANLADSATKLALLERPSRRIEPGQYRCYIAPAGVADILGMFSWHGLGEADMQTGESAFLRMRQEGVKLSPKFSLSEDFREGRVPRFNDHGEVAPELIELIRAGELVNTLVSSRSAREFGVESNFAAEDEGLRSPVMAAGDLPESEVLQALGTGVYLSNLHYLNWSDVAGGRITGMTRYACFWVENGEIAGPIENMRFDDSFYHFFGEQLEAVTRERQVIPEVGSYGERDLGAVVCPGILLESFALTL
jgi:predicted Zn-dependent protease